MVVLGFGGIGEDLARPRETSSMKEFVNDRLRNVCMPGSGTDWKCEFVKGGRVQGGFWECETVEWIVYAGLSDILFNTVPRDPVLLGERLEAFAALG